MKTALIKMAALAALTVSSQAISLDISEPVYQAPSGVQIHFTVTDYPVNATSVNLFVDSIQAFPNASPGLSGWSINDGIGEFFWSEPGPHTILFSYPGTGVSVGGNYEIAGTVNTPDGGATALLLGAGFSAIVLGSLARGAGRSQLR